MQCPSGFYGSSSKRCLTCNNSTAAACSAPLEFTTKVYIENFTYVINVTFNQIVTYGRSLEEILKVNLKLQRRLLAVDDLVNNGVPFRFEILSDGTIKLYLEITDNLVDPVFVVQIADPTAVTSSENNSTLQNS